MIKVNDKEIENIFFNGTKLDHVYVNGVMVYESTVYVAKPTISGAYTFDTLEHKAVINNTNEDAYVISGVTNASAAGIYTVKFTLNKGYAWKDESTDPIELKWSIAKRVISVPKLNATSFVWVEGAQHGVIVNGIDTTYVSQSGDLSQTDNSNNIGAQHAVTWSLKYPASTTWTDGSNSNKSQTWAVTWQNGTSHYAADLYNLGWNSGKLAAGTERYSVDWGSASTPMITAIANSSGSAATAIIYLKVSDYTQYINKTFHVYAKGTSYTGYIVCLRDDSTSVYTNCASSSENRQSSEWAESWGISTDATPSRYRGRYAYKNTGYDTVYIQRVWIT